MESKIIVRGISLPQNLANQLPNPAGAVDVSIDIVLIPPAPESAEYGLYMPMLEFFQTVFDRGYKAVMNEQNERKRITHFSVIKRQGQGHGQYTYMPHNSKKAAMEYMEATRKTTTSILYAVVSAFELKVVEKYKNDVSTDIDLFIAHYYPEIQRLLLENKRQNS